MLFPARPLRIRLTRALGHNLRSLNSLAERRKELELKYAEKLDERVKKEGLSDLEDLKVKLLGDKRLTGNLNLDKSFQTPEERRMDRERRMDKERRMDSSSIKPLECIMDVQKVQTDLTAEQISALWITYHTTNSRAAGHGYLSATIPLATYFKMTSRALNYPTFVLPLQRPVLETGDQRQEFYFLQWRFHDIPPHLGPEKPTLANSTILFTPLEEYKVRNTFAIPCLVLTHYTDLATTHGIVLIRGEFTPSLSSASQYYLSQTDAQLLAMGMQRLYLAAEEGGSARLAELLQEFHEAPKEFQWEDLFAFADPTALE